MRLILKAKRMPVGTISHGRKKVAEGKWVKLTIGREKSGATLQANLNKAENSIANLEYEKCFAFDSNGKELLEKSGDEHSITFTLDDLGVFEPGTIFTHNHPSDCSFSPTDLQTAFVRDFGEIRAVSKDAVYSAKFRKGIEWDGFVDTANEIDNMVRDVSWKKIDSGELTKEDAGAQHWHLVWTMVGDSVDGFEYTKKERTR